MCEATAPTDVRVALAGLRRMHAAWTWLPLPPKRLSRLYQALDAPTPVRDIRTVHELAYGSARLSYQVVWRILAAMLDQEQRDGQGGVECGGVRRTPAVAS